MGAKIIEATPRSSRSLNNRTMCIYTKRNRRKLVERKGGTSEMIELV